MFCHNILPRYVFTVLTHHLLQTLPTRSEIDNTIEQKVKEEWVFYDMLTLIIITESK